MAPIEEAEAFRRMLWTSDEARVLCIVSKDLISYTSRALGSFVERSHVAIWRWHKGLIPNNLPMNRITNWKY
jgi:hypothetical protein